MACSGWCRHSSCRRRMNDTAIADAKTEKEPRVPDPRPGVIRIILADDHLAVRAGLKALLGASKDIEVVGEATNGRDAVALVERLAPHVAVLDLDMPQMDGLAATKELVARASATRVLILTMH